MPSIGALFALSTSNPESKVQEQATKKINENKSTHGEKHQPTADDT